MPVTNPASLGKIVTEFGGPGNLRAYNRGGAYVPDTPANAAISTNPDLLAISQFVGASAAPAGPTVAMANDSGYSSLQTGTVSCSLTLYVNGSYLIDTPNFDPNGPWLTSGVASDVDVYVTNSGSPLTSGTLNTWINLGTQQSWVVSTNVNGGKLSNLTLTFRNKNTLAQLDTAAVTLEVWRGTPI